MTQGQVQPSEFVFQQQPTHMLCMYMQDGAWGKEEDRTGNIYQRFVNFASCCLFRQLPIVYTVAIVDGLNVFIRLWHNSLKQLTTRGMQCIVGWLWCEWVHLCFISRLTIPVHWFLRLSLSVLGFRKHVEYCIAHKSSRMNIWNMNLQCTIYTFRV